MSPGPLGGLGRLLPGGCGVKGVRSLSLGGGGTCLSRLLRRLRGGRLLPTFQLGAIFGGWLTLLVTWTFSFLPLGWVGVGR